MQSHKTKTRHHNGHPKTGAYVWTMVMDIEKKTRYRSVKVLNTLLSRLKIESYKDRMKTNKTHQNTQENRRKGNISSCLWHGTRNFWETTSWRMSQQRFTKLRCRCVGQLAVLMSQINRKNGDVEGTVGVQVVKTDKLKGQLNFKS